MLTKDDFLDIIHANTDSVVINGKREIVLLSSSFDKVIDKLLERDALSVQKDELTEVSTVKCDLCGHEWVAVRPATSLTRLECPNCSNMVHFENV